MTLTKLNVYINSLCKGFDYLLFCLTLLVADVRLLQHTESGLFPPQ